MNDSLSRRTFVAGTAALAATLSACGSGATTDAAATDETTDGAAADTPRKVVRFGMSPLGAPLDMQKNGMSVAGTLTDSIFEGLLTWTDDLGLVPTLLTEIPSFEPDGVTLPCTLKEGVPFHDGSTLTSTDVKFTFERLFSPATGASNFSNYTQIKGAKEMLAGVRDDLDEGIVIQDDTHFCFVLEEPSSTFVPSLGINYASIYPHDACAAAGDDWGIGANAIGTGKYRLVENDDTTEAVFERFESYHDGTPNLDEVRIVYYNDANTKLLGFKNGDIDWCDIGFSLYGQYKDDPDFQGLTHPYLPLGLQFVNLNLSDPALQDIRVRQALSLAINRQEIVDTIMDGQGQAASGWLTPQIPGFDEGAEAFAYDPERARELLVDAGAENLHLEFKTRAMFKTIAEAIQGYWMAVGIDCSLEQMENGTFMSDWSAGSIQVLVNGWFADYPNADGMFATYFTSDQSPHRSSFYANPEFDELVARARVTRDEDEQAELYRQADDILTRQDWATIPILYPHYNFACKPYVRGAKVGNMSFHMWDIDVDVDDPGYPS